MKWKPDDVVGSYGFNGTGVCTFKQLSPSVQSALNSEGELVEALEKLSDPYCRGAVEIARAALSKYRSRRVG